LNLYNVFYVTEIESKNMKIFILLFLMSFVYGISYADSLTVLPIKMEDSIRIKIKVKAIDLSEDGVPGATMNDEVFFFMYKQNGKCLPQNVFSSFFKLDTAKKEQLFKITTDKILPTDTLTFILLEQDSNKQIKGIEPVCRLYLNELYANYQKNGTQNFFSYFDEDDVLGMFRISGDKFDLSKSITKKFESLNLFDWAVYKLEISMQ